MLKHILCIVKLSPKIITQRNQGGGTHCGAGMEHLEFLQRSLMEKETL